MEATAAIAREQKLLYPGNDLATPTTTAAAAAKEIALRRQWQQFAANISFKKNYRLTIVFVNSNKYD